MYVIALVNRKKRTLEIPEANLCRNAVRFVTRGLTLLTPADLSQRTLL